MTPQPSSHPVRSAELQSLLDQQRPATVLAKTAEPDLAPVLAVYRALALADLDRPREARTLLEPALPLLTGDDKARASCAWAALLLDGGDSDGAIQAAKAAASATADPGLRAAAFGWAARGYSRKHCWGLARESLRQALELAPCDREVLAARGRVALEMDERLMARAAYEHLATVNRADSAWGLATVAYLLGEFSEALTLLDEAITSDEVVGPLFLRAQLAYVTTNLALLEATVDLIARRSPEAEALPALQAMVAELREHVAAPQGGKRVQLKAFPTLVQRRDHCGPCTVELVLRYWRGGVEITNEEIARAIKEPGGGTPIYRMREYFHLLGFDTVRCRASIGQIKRVVDAGLPVIVEERFPNSSHVTVVVGYDEEAGSLLFQDPMTHALTTLPVDTVSRLRAFVCDAALIAFPAGQGYDRTLALMDLYDDQALVWLDQAALALDNHCYDEAASLARRAVSRLPGLELGWATWLLAELSREQAQAPVRSYSLGSVAVQLHQPDEAPRDAGERIAAVLAAALPVCQSAAVRQIAGRAAIRSGDYGSALAALEQARQLEPDSALTYALLAECHAELRQQTQALDAATRAIRLDPSLPMANSWMARCAVGEDPARALHFARCAADLAPDAWLAQLALAEAQHACGDLRAARAAIGTARMLAPHEPHVCIAYATWLAASGAVADAAAELETLLAGRRPLSPAAAFTARQALCRLLFGGGHFAMARNQIALLLEGAPADPWALQFRAAVMASEWIAAGKAGDDAVIAELRSLYSAAISANEGAPWVVRDYGAYLAALAGPDAAADAVAALRTAYPAQGLAALHGELAERAGRIEEAAAAMVEALGEPGALDDHNTLGHAVSVVLAGIGVEAGAAAVLGAPGTMIPLATRERFLGMALSKYEEGAGRATELLRRSLEVEPDHASTLLRLGDVAANNEERGQYYRRALMLAPGWGYARLRLARLLAAQSRWFELLHLTSGHTDEALELMELYGRALFHLGRFEEAADCYAELTGQLAAPPAWLMACTWRAQKYAGRYEQAIETAHQAVQRFPDQPEWHLRIALALVAGGSYDDALAVVRTAREHGLDEEGELEIAYEVALARDEQLPALEIAMRGWGLEPQRRAGELSNWEHRVVRHLVNGGRVDEARALVAERDLNADGWGYAAWKLGDTRRWDLVLEFAEQSLEREATSYPGLFSSAMALRELGREDEARAGYERLRQAHPDEHNGYEKLALLLALEGRTDEALVQAEHAVALGAFCHLAWATRGYVAFVRGEHDRALADLEAAWIRADGDARGDDHVFWWVRASLRGEAETAARERALALADAATPFTRDHVAQVEGLLNRVA